MWKNETAYNITKNDCHRSRGNEDGDVIDYQLITEMSFSFWGERHFCNVLKVRQIVYLHEIQVFIICPVISAFFS